MQSETENPVTDLIRMRAFNPESREHASIISSALLRLGYCSDTMALLLERTGIRDIKDHKETYDNLHRGAR